MASMTFTVGAPWALGITGRSRERAAGQRPAVDYTAEGWSPIRRHRAATGWGSSLDVSPKVAEERLVHLPFIRPAYGCSGR